MLVKVTQETEIHTTDNFVELFIMILDKWLFNALEFAY